MGFASPLHALCLCDSVVKSTEESPATAHLFEPSRLRVQTTTATRQTLPRPDHPQKGQEAKRPPAQNQHEFKRAPYLSSSSLRLSEPCGVVKRATYTPLARPSASSVT